MANSQRQQSGWRPRGNRENLQKTYCNFLWLILFCAPFQGESNCLRAKHQSIKLPAATCSPSPPPRTASAWPFQVYALLGASFPAVAVLSWSQSIYSICNLYNVAYDEYLRASISLLLCRLFSDSFRAQGSINTQTERDGKRKREREGRQALCVNVSLDKSREKTFSDCLEKLSPRVRSVCIPIHFPLPYHGFHSLFMQATPIHE